MESSETPPSCGGTEGDNVTSPSRPTIAIVLASAAGGGAERVSIQLANELARRGRTVTLVFITDRGRLFDLIDPMVKVRRLGADRILFGIWRLAREVRDIRPDVVVAAMVGANIATTIAARLAHVGTRVILTEHNQTDRNFEVGRKRSVRLAYRMIRFVYPLADRVVCVSRGVAESLQKFAGIAAKRMTVIHNPIIPEDLDRLISEDCPHSWTSDDSIPVILAVGRLVGAKNFEMLLHAFARLRQSRPCRLIILGEGPLHGKLDAIVRDLGIDTDVDMPGFDSNPYRYMHRTDLFALSSDWEGFPTVLVEALACGARIASTDCPSGPNEILAGGQFGELAPVGDIEAFSAAMAKALDAPAKSGSVARGREFTIGRAVEQYEALVDSLCEERV